MAMIEACRPRLLAAQTLATRIEGSLEVLANALADRDRSASLMVELLVWQMTEIVEALDVAQAVASEVERAQCAQQGED